MVPRPWYVRVQACSFSATCLTSGTSRTSTGSSPRSLRSPSRRAGSGSQSRRCQSDVHLQRLEGPPGEGALHPIAHGQPRVGFPERFAAGEREGELVAHVLGNGEQQIRARRLGAGHPVVRVQVHRGACAIPETGFEGHPTLERPPAWRHAREPHQQALKRRLPADDVRGDAQSVGTLAQPGLDGCAEGGGGSVYSRTRTSLGDRPLDQPAHTRGAGFCGGAQLALGDEAGRECARRGFRDHARVDARLG